jgi:asparagine synthase (glutamine-hydrolysing)
MRHFLGYATSGIGAYIQANDRMRYYHQHGILGERLASLDRARPYPATSFDSARHLLPEVLERFYNIHFAGEFMPKVDGATMYYSVESRSPFLDQKLWEFAAKLPPALHFKGNVLKAILRDIVRRQVSPEIATRRKQGFTVPLERWLAGSWTSALEVLLQPNKLEQQGWIRPGSLAKPIAEARARQWAPKQLWCLLLLEHWLDRQKSSLTPELLSVK